MKKSIVILSILILIFAFWEINNPIVEADYYLLPPYDLPDNLTVYVDAGTYNFKGRDITINYPKGDITFMLGQPVIVKFTVKEPGNYKIYGSNDMGLNWSYISSVIVGDDLIGYIPFKNEKSGRLRIKVVCDASDTEYDPNDEDSEDESSDDEGYEDYISYDNKKSYRIKFVIEGETRSYDASNDCYVSSELWDGSLKANADNNKIILSWKRPAYVTGEMITYNIYRNIHPDFKSSDLLNQKTVNKDITTDGEITFIDSDVVTGSKYYYKVIPVIENCAVDNVYDVVSAVPQKSIILTIGSKYMIVNGQQQEINPDKSTVPVIVGQRTYLPIKGVVLAIGGSVLWDGLQQKITVNNNGKILELQINSNIIKVNGTAKQMDAAPFISEMGSTMVPLRVVSEYLGCEVNWDGENQKITILYK